MKKITYGTIEYAKNELAKKTLCAELIKESIATRITNGIINADNLEDYAEILKFAEQDLAYAENYANEVEEQQK
ncbi:MAG: hypothetical protein RR348_01485 [Clostridia bacterium]